MDRPVKFLIIDIVESSCLATSQKKQHTQEQVKQTMQSTIKTVLSEGTKSKQARMRIARFFGKPDGYDEEEEDDEETEDGENASSLDVGHKDDEDGSEMEDGEDTDDGDNDTADEGYATARSGDDDDDDSMGTEDSDLTRAQEQDKNNSVFKEGLMTQASVFLFGRLENGESMTIQTHFEPFMYIHLDHVDHFEPMKSWIIDRINEKMKHRLAHSLVRFELAHKQSFRCFLVTPEPPKLKIYFKNLAIARIVQGFFEDRTFDGQRTQRPLRIPGVTPAGQTKKIQLYESCRVVDILLKFIHDRDIEPPAMWIELHPPFKIISNRYVLEKERKNSDVVHNLNDRTVSEVRLHPPEPAFSVDQCYDMTEEWYKRTRRALGSKQAETLAAQVATIVCTTDYTVFADVHQIKKPSQPLTGNNRRICVFDLECYTYSGSFPSAIQTYMQTALAIAGTWLHGVTAVTSEDDASVNDSTRKAKYKNELAKAYKVNPRLFVTDALSVATKSTVVAPRISIPDGYMTREDAIAMTTEFFSDVRRILYKTQPDPKRVQLALTEMANACEKYTCDSERRDQLSVDLFDAMSKYLPELKGDPIIQASLCFCTCDTAEPYQNYMLVVGSCDPLDMDINCTLVTVESERDLLLQFSYLVRMYDPDIITGYNINGFDTPFLIKRAAELDIAQEFNCLGRIRYFKSFLMSRQQKIGAKETDTVLYIVTPGRIQLDLMVECKRRFQLASYALDNVVAEYIKGDISNVEYDETTGMTRFSTDSIFGLRQGNFVTFSKSQTGLAPVSYANEKKFRIERVQQTGKKAGGVGIFYIAGNHADAFSRSVPVAAAEPTAAPAVKTEDEKLWAKLINKKRYKGYKPAFEYPPPSEIPPEGKKQPVKITFTWSLGKNDMTPQMLFKKHLGGPQDRSDIAKYCLIDSVLCNQLIYKHGIILSIASLSSTVMVPYAYIINRGQGVQTVSLVTKFISRFGYVLPDLYRDMFPRDALGYEGAVVLDPKPGMYRTPVVTLDFNSLYPTCQRQCNMCMSTIVTDPYYLGPEGGKRLEELGITYIDVSFDEMKYPPCTDETKRLTKQSRVKTGKLITVRFVQHKRGIVPQLHEYLVDMRKHVRNKIEFKRVELKDGTVYIGKYDADKAEVSVEQPPPAINKYTAIKLNVDDIASVERGYTDDEVSVFESQQLACKLAGNSIYGAFGAITSAIFCKEIAASTTAVGRIQLMKAKNFVENPKNYRQVLASGEVIELQNKVIYGDTDSVFVVFQLFDQFGVPLTGRDALVRAFELGRYTEQALMGLAPEASGVKNSTMYKNKSVNLNPLDDFIQWPQVLAFEKAFLPFLLMARKRYAGPKFADNPDKSKLAVNGISLKRRDSCGLLKIILGHILYMVCNDAPMQAAVNYYLEALLRLISGRYYTERDEAIVEPGTDSDADSVPDVVTTTTTAATAIDHTPAPYSFADPTASFGIDSLVLTKRLSVRYAVPERIAIWRLAQKIKQRNDEDVPRPGDRVSYIVVDTRTKIDPKRSESVKAMDQLETVVRVKRERLPIDFTYYIQTQLGLAISQVIALELESISQYRDYVDQMRTDPIEEYKRQLIREGIDPTSHLFFQKILAKKTDLAAIIYEPALKLVHMNRIRRLNGCTMSKVVVRTDKPLIDTIKPLEPEVRARLKREFEEQEQKKKIRLEKLKLKQVRERQQQKLMEGQQRITLPQNTSVTPPPSSQPQQPNSSHLLDTPKSSTSESEIKKQVSKLQMIPDKKKAKSAPSKQISLDSFISFKKTGSRSSLGGK